MANRFVGNASRPVAAMLLVLLTVFLLALGDSVTKHLVERYPVQVVMAGRFLVGFLLLQIFFGPRLGRRLWRTEKVFLVIARSLTMTMGSFFMGFALQRMPVGETVAIAYVAPLVVMLLAIPLFGEKVRAASWAFAALGFLGVLLIVRPGGGLDTLGLVFCIANLACYSAYQILTRVLSKTESSIAMAANLSLVGAVIVGGIAAPFWGNITPNVVDIGLIVMLGATWTLGHFLFSVAFRLAPASLVAPIGYFHLVWAALFGWALFNHLPDLWTLAGMSMIVVSGVSIALIAYMEGRPA